MKRIIDIIFSLIFIRFTKLYSRMNLVNWLNNTLDIHCNVKKQKILEIGSGGIISKIIKRKGIYTKTIDIDPDRKPDIVCSVEKMDFLDDESIDVIICMEVVEHIKNPFNASIEFERVLKKKGKLIGSTVLTYPLHDEPHDYYRYTKYGLQNLFNNLNKIEIIERNTYIDTIIMLLLLAVDRNSLAQKLISLALFPIIIFVIILSYPFNILIRNKRLTTGYYFVFEK